MRRAAAQPPRVTSPLARLTTRQHGIVARRQLVALDVSPSAIATMLSGGLLIRIHSGVYAVGHAKLSLRGHWTAGVLACGELAWLSHGDALALHELRRSGAGLIHVTAVGFHRVAGVRCHVAREPEQLGRTVVDGIPVTGIERAALDVAVGSSRPRLRSLLEEIERQNRFDRRRFDALLLECNGHRGTGVLRAALAELDDCPPWLDSELEAAFLALIRAAGLPEPSANVLVAGHRVDFSWPAHRVVVEIDSWRYHRGRCSFEEDRRRVNAFALAGVLALRITDERIATEPAAVVAEVAAALGVRG